MIKIIITKKLPKTLITTHLPPSIFEWTIHDVISIQYLPFTREVKPQQHLIITSLHAAKVIVQHTPVHILHTCSIYCVGTQIRDYISTHCRATIVLCMPYARELASAIVEEYKHVSFAFYCGRKHLKDLPDVLSENHVKCHTCEVYDTIAVSTPTDTSGVDGIVFFSPSGVDSFFQSNALPSSTMCFCIGTTTALQLTSFVKKERILTSAHPSVKATLEAVQDYFY